LSVFCNAQKLHEPSEIFKLMSDSPVKYGIQNLKRPILSTDYSKNLNQLNCYRVVKDSSIHSVGYNLRDSAQNYFNKAEALFDSNPDSSLYYYTLMRTAQPELYFGLTYSGQLVAILKKAKRKYNDWYFTPQVELKGTLGKEATISTDSKWLGYGLSKALWEFEPGYRQSMGVDSGEISTTEYKECLYVMLVSMENSKTNIKKIPQLRILREAALNKHLNEYIMYEVVLPEHPFVACQLPEESIAEIKDYLLNVRYK